ncbi:MAG: potassium-transporting ATPase subunit KdpC [Eubacteriales bacterium]|nr:potassium-transporting ATPase subunit KdpC [Eubacteriales bacterium]
MKSFLKYLKSGVILTVLMLVICGFAYPAALTGLGQLIFPNQANGSLITAEGKKTSDPDEAVGSAIVGQDFSGDERYFQGRVSSINYNTYDNEEEALANVSSGNTNYGATNEELKARVKEDVEEFIKTHPDVEKGEIPADLLTASGSGMDPDITPESAEIQIPAIAKASGLSEEELHTIVENNTQGKLFGIFGHERVNVLKCNLEIAAAIGEI